MNTVDMTKHSLFSRTLDWRSILKDKAIMWEDWYKTPLWRKWQDKQDGNSDEYEPMHDMENFESPHFLMLVEKMNSEETRRHAQLTPEMHEVLEKVLNNCTVSGGLLTVHTVNKRMDIYFLAW